MEAKGGTGGVGRKDGGSDPTMELAPLDEKGAALFEGGAKGGGGVLEGNVGRAGFSVPIVLHRQKSKPTC